MAGKKDLIRLRKRKRRKQNIIRATIHFFVWAGVAVLYYIGFSVFFDTPVEYELKHSTDRLRREYTALVQRYDTLTTVMRNLSERDRNVFRILFESDPTTSTRSTSASRPPPTKTSSTVRRAVSNASCASAWPKWRRGSTS